MPTLNYSYWFKSPQKGSKDATTLHDALWNSHQFRCALMKHNRVWWKKLDDLYRSYHPEMPEVEGEKPAEKKARKAAWLLAHPVTKSTEELERTNAMRVEENTAYKKLYAAHPQVHSTTKTFWRRSLELKSTAAIPSFDDGAIIAVQMQKPEDFNRYVQLNHLPRLKGKRRNNRYAFTIRIGTVNRRQPITIDVSGIVHRPLPTGAVVKEYKIIKSKRKCKHTYQFLITAEVPLAPHDDSREPMVAIDLGWRNDSGSLRVGAWYGSNGQNDVVMLPAWSAKPRTWTDPDKVGTSRAGITVHMRMQKADSIRSHRDLLLDALRAKLKTIPVDNWPDSSVAMYAYLHNIKSYKRYIRLYKNWLTTRPDTLPMELVEWTKRDKHLWLYETGLRERAIRARNNHFREVAAYLASRYQDVAFEEIDLAALSQKKKNKDAKKVAPRQRFQVAAGEFRRFVIEAFAKHGGVPVYVDPAYTTRVCNTCGHENVKDLKTYLRCANCGAHYDCDVNAAKNIFARAEGLRENAVTLAAEKAKENRARTLAKREKGVQTRKANRAALANAAES